MSNINQNKKYHFLYKTTNKITKKYYIGIHSTSNLKDGYLGSGKRLRKSILKHGKENFLIEILEFHNSRLELLKREKEIVNSSLINDEMCMNLQIGGGGGICNEEHKKKLRKGASDYQKKIREDKECLEKIKKMLKESSMLARKNGSYDNVNYATFLGKKHTLETKQKIS